MGDVTVRLAIGNFSAEATGPVEYVDRKLEELIGKFLTPGKAAGAEARTGGRPAVETGGKKASPGEFLKKASAKNQTDKGLVLGYYLERVREVADFTSSDLGTLGREAKQPFGNPSDIIAKLTARGLMMSAGEKDGQRAYSLTASGEEYVEAMMEERG